MAASAGTVTLNLDANSVKLLRELQKSQNATRKASRSMASDFEQSFNRIAKTGQQMAKYGAIIAGVTAVMIRSQMNQLDALGKSSSALGVQQERLQALMHVSELAGISSDSLTTNLARMQKRLGEIARIGGQAEKALADVGVSIDDVINLSPDRQLDVLAGAFGNVENATIKASIANDIFGRDGFRMLELMRSLEKDGLDPVVAKLERWGIAISRVDTAKIERANDNIFEVTQVLQGMFQRITVPASELIVLLTKGFLDAADGAGDMGDKIDSVFDDMVVKGIQVAGSFRTVFAGVTGALDGAWAGYKSLPDWAQEVGIAGVLIGGKKGALGLIALSKAADQTRVTAAWFAAFTNGDIGFAEWVSTGADGARERLKELGFDLDQISDKSDSFSIIDSLFGAGADDTWVNETIAAYRAGIEKINAEAAATVLRPSMGGMSVEDEAQADKDAEELDAARQKAGDFLNILRDRYATEEQLLANKFMAEDAQLAFAYENGLLKQEEFNALMLAMTDQFEKEQTAIVTAQEDARKSARAAATDAILNNLDRQITAIRGYTEENSVLGKIAFVASQAMSAASAIISGYSAAASIREAYAKLAATTGNPALAAAGEAHAATSIGMGYVTAGLIAGQTIGSFEGGGYTGDGLRSGGIDGRGGFLSIIHPNETIIDHANGQGGAVQVNFAITANDSRGFDQLLQSRRGLITGMINQAVNNSGRRSIA